MRHSRKQLFTVSVLFTFLFYFLANGYRFFHTLFAGDSLYMIYQNDAGWEISLGRFIQPFLVALRGAITSPFLISVLSVLWISLSVCLVVDFLEIKRMASAALIAAVMSCNITVLSLNATFLPYLDFYLFALFLSVSGVWLMKKERPAPLILGSLCLSISLGIYQSYICVSIALVMIHFLNTIPEQATFRHTFRKAVKYLLSFMAAAIVYFAVWKLFQKVFDIWTADSYNGMASVGDFSETGIVSVIAMAYRGVLDHFIYPQTFITNTFRGISMSLLWTYLLRVCNLAVILMIIYATFRISQKRGTGLWQRWIRLLILVLFPLGINFVSVMSKGMEHSLMIYSFYFVYILAIKQTEDCLPESGQLQKPKCTPWAVVLGAVMILSWVNIVYSNQVYLKRELQESAAQSIMTRIISRVESMDDYIPGVTPVAFTGNFESSPCMSETGPFEDIQLYSMGKTILTYPGTNQAFLTYVLNMNVNLTHVDSADETILQMPVYPAEGSIAYVDDILVIKISEEYK